MSQRPKFVHGSWGILFPFAFSQAQTDSTAHSPVMTRRDHGTVSASALARAIMQEDQHG